MFCTNCGQRLADGAKRCPTCGTPVEGAVLEENVNEVVEVVASAVNEAAPEAFAAETPVAAQTPAAQETPETPVTIVPAAAGPVVPEEGPHVVSAEAPKAGGYHYEEPKTSSYSFYSEPVTPPAPVSDPTKDTLALVGFICALVSLLLCCLQPYILLVGAAGLVCSIMGLKSTRRHGLAVAGIALACIALVLGLFIVIVGALSAKAFGDTLGTMDAEQFEQYLESLGFSIS